MRKSAIEQSLKYQKYLQRQCKNSRKVTSLKEVGFIDGYAFDGTVAKDKDPSKKISELPLTACNRLMTQYEAFRKIALDNGDGESADKMLITYNQLAERRNDIIADANHQTALAKARAFGGSGND